MNPLSRTLATLAALFAAHCSSHAAVTVFQNDLAAFTATVGPLPVIDFELLTPGTDLANTTTRGITFSSPLGNTLEVVNAAATASGTGFVPVEGDTDNRLFATSGANVLSPGGTALVRGNDLREKDGLRLVFAVPVRDFGIDVLFQSRDDSSFTDFEVRDSAGVLIATGHVDLPPPLGPGADPTSSYPAGGSVFIGFHSDQADIAQIDFIESDDNATYPDSNIGYDDIRVLAASPQSGRYKFTQIVDNSLSLVVDQSPEIDNQGNVIFVGRSSPSEFVNLRSRSSTGGPVTTLVDSSDGIVEYLDHTVSGAGTVAFSSRPGPPFTFTSGVFSQNGTASGNVTVVADDGGPLAFLYASVLNNAGRVVFSAELDSMVSPRPVGIFARSLSGGPIVTLADDTGPLAFGYHTNFLESPDINNAGTVAFEASFDAGGEGIFTVSSNGGPITTVIDSSAGFLSLAFPAINDAGTVAFRTVSPGSSILTASSAGGPTTTIADTSGAFSSFTRVALNNAGTVAFSAELTAGGMGIFTGPDPINDRVIGTGDPLFGSTVLRILFTREGFNDLGQIAFYYELADNRFGVAVATLLTPAERWRKQYFGTIENTGNAANNADPDGDGRVNLLERAFGLDPTSAQSGPITVSGNTITPGEPTMGGNVLSGFHAIFGRRSDYVAAGLTYTVQFSIFLGVWTDSTATPAIIADDGTMQVVSVPFPSGAQFFRVLVSEP